MTYNVSDETKAQTKNRLKKEEREAKQKAAREEREAKQKANQAEKLKQKEKLEAEKELKMLVPSRVNKGSKKPKAGAATGNLVNVYDRSDLLYRHLSNPTS